MPTLEAEIHEAPGAIQVLAGELILCAARTSPPPQNLNDPAMSLGMHLGGAGGLVKSALGAASRAGRREPLPFKLRGALAIALTPTRFLFWTYEGVIRQKPRTFVGELAVNAVEKVELSRRRGKLAFWLRSGASVELDVKDRDNETARAFTAMACERIAAAI